MESGEARLDRVDVIAQPWPRMFELDAVAAHDVGPDLRAEAEPEPATGELLELPGRSAQPDDHRAERLELQELTGGRFRLGLGTQVRTHVVRRYGVEFEHPGPRLRDYVRAVKACFAGFRGEPLDHHGEFYELTFLNRQWSPGPLDVADPKVDIAAVNPWMLTMAGEVADGVHVHPIGEPGYLARHVLPCLSEGAIRAGRPAGEVDVIVPVTTIVGDTDEERTASRAGPGGALVLRVDPELRVHLGRSWFRGDDRAHPNEAEGRRLRRDGGRDHRRSPRCVLHRGGLERPRRSVDRDVRRDGQPARAVQRRDGRRRDARALRRRRERDLGAHRGIVIAALRAALLAGTAVVLAACAASSPPPGSDPLDGALPSAIGVRADGCNPSDDVGSGSMIDTDLAVTAAHVVAGSTDVRVVDSGGTVNAAEVVLFDPGLDIAVLRTASPIGTPLRVGASPEAGDRGTIVTFRDTDGERALVVSHVRVVRTVNIDTTDIYLDEDVTRAGFEVTAEIEPGDSGAVVVVPGGVAVGMIWARSTQRTDRAWAIDLPTELGDAEQRAALTDPVDVGACVG